MSDEPSQMKQTDQRTDTPADPKSNTLRMSAADQGEGRESYQAAKIVGRTSRTSHTSRTSDTKSDRKHEEPTTGKQSLQAHLSDQPHSSRRPHAESAREPSSETHVPDQGGEGEESDATPAKREGLVDTHSRSQDIADSQSASGKSNVVLMGMMGVGKSRVGWLLAHRLGFGFVDLDKEIELRERLSIAEIFEQKGEAYFRLCEARMLEKLAGLRNHVIAVGGGAVMDDGCWQQIKAFSRTVWLDVELNQLARRLLQSGESARRPLIQACLSESSSSQADIEGDDSEGRDESEAAALSPPGDAGARNASKEAEEPEESKDSKACEERVLERLGKLMQKRSQRYAEADLYCNAGAATEELVAQQIQGLLSREEKVT